MSVNRKALSYSVAAFLLAISPCVTVFAQQSAFTITADGAYCLPVGLNSEAFSYGGSGSITGLYRLQSAESLGLGGILDFTYVKQLGGSSIYNLGVLAAARFGINLGTFVTLYGQLAGGALIARIRLRADTPYESGC